MTQQTNYGKLVAHHKIKFIHWRTHTEIEDDINKWLTANLWKQEIKEIKLDLSQTWSWLAMIHYYEHVRMDRLDDVKTTDNKKVSSWWTRHIAPSQTTIQSHNKKLKSNSQLDMLKVNQSLKDLEPQVKPKKEIDAEPQNNPKIPEWYTVASKDVTVTQEEPEAIQKEHDTNFDKSKPINELMNPEWELADDNRGDFTQEEIDEPTTIW